ncbi:MAG: efflux RND transporter periplasmic adaptor subunit [Lentimicrobium sp.]|jgi:RND family efflux transporter MFP subunit|nr:efflux RND transporter periplasmic adaptor subunit [Lentimicrobium sp.]MDY0025156.1 efflux RND transporter periplasmic adaptor subunit [Lentimicrobium sp.]HAH57500.1 efflux RND transporter periplasmic adaptor subunit [Bacteroidales bacterium]
MKTLIKKSLILTAVVLFAVACNKPADKKAQLADLKKQRDELNMQIQSLEQELGGSDSLANKKMTTVAITEAEKSSFDHYIEVQGKVDGEDNIAVSAQTPGLITAVLVKEGDAVKKGEVMALTDNSVLQQQIENVKTQLNFATNLYNKQKALWDQEIGSEVQYLTAKNNKESLEANLAALNDQLEMTKIKSPINGTVEEVNLKVGQMASPGMPAVRVVNFSSAKVVADISETYASRVKKGDKVIVFFPDFKKEIETKIHFTSKYINPVNRTFLTEVKLRPSDIEYRANMLAVVKINDYTNPSTFVIPVSLLKESSSGKYIYTAKEENGRLIARRKIVEVGRTYNGMAEIISGLEKGDKIITTGYNNLVEGQLIKLNGTQD